MAILKSSRSLRVVVALLLILAFSGALSVAAVTGAAVAQEPSSAAVRRLTAARAAIGGADQLAAVKTMILKGNHRLRFQRMQRGADGTMSASGARYHAFRDEMRIILPDHYLHVSESPTMPALGNREGFAGATIIGTGVVGKWRNPEAFGYLVFSLLLRTDTIFPFSLEGVSGNAVELADRNGVTVFLDLEPGSNLPRRLRFDMPARTNDGQLTGGPPRRTVIEISNYKLVGRLRLPHMLTTFRDGAMTNEQRFDSIELNPPLTADTFKK